VREDLAELLGGQHALVDEGPRRQRREVRVGLPLGALAQHEREALQRQAGEGLPSGRGDEDLAEGRHRGERGGAERLGLDRDLAPAEDGQALVDGDLLDDLDRARDLCGVAGQEGGADGVRPGGGQVEVHDLAQEGVRDLDQDACSVAGVGLSACGTAVVEVDQRGDTLLHDFVGGDTGQGRHEGDATGVLLVRWVVETLRSRVRVLIGHGRSPRLSGAHQLTREGDNRGVAVSADPGVTQGMCCRRVLWGTTLALTLRRTLPACIGLLHSVHAGGTAGSSAATYGDSSRGRCLRPTMTKYASPPRKTTSAVQSLSLRPRNVCWIESTRRYSIQARPTV